jgi:hypothetical protein
LLNASDFQGGHLDWYSFSVETGKPNDVSSQYPANVRQVSFNFLPNHVVFRGMPEARWWNFEDSVIDFGQLDTDTVDLPKLLVTSFALVYGNDWFSVPVPVTVGISGSDSKPRGTLSRVTALVVTDTFGVRTLIRAAEQTTANSGHTTWSMYKISGKNTRSDFIFMAPTLGVVEDAEALEEVIFLRDDIAAMAWAVEHQFQGDLDSAVDAHQMYLQGKNPPGGVSKQPPATEGPQVSYRVETLPPGNWIPMVPVQTSKGALYFRRGTMEIPSGTSTSPGLQKLASHAAILDPGLPFFVADHVISSAGVQVNRYFRRTRSSDGKTFVWLARKSRVGRGPGWSGLRFDVLQNTTAGGTQA